MTARALDGTPSPEREAVERLRFLADARKDYCHRCPEHAGDYEAMTAMQVAVHEEHAAATWLADILAGENDGRGWLPSWRWDEWDRLKGTLAADREPGLREAASGITTHNGAPVTPEQLRYAATHEALCRSWIFDVLTGLADALDGTR